MLTDHLSLALSKTTKNFLSTYRSSHLKQGFTLDFTKHKRVMTWIAPMVTLVNY